MKTPQQIRNEVEKGCGILFYYEDKELGTIHLKCGKWVEINSCHQKMEWCPSCQAKLSILTEYDKSIKEMIENVIGDWWMRKRGIEGRALNDFVQRHVANELIKELLSKIGDNSDNSQESSQAVTRLATEVSQSETELSSHPDTRKGCGKEYDCIVVQDNNIHIGKAKCDGTGAIPYCLDCKERMKELGGDEQEVRPNKSLSGFGGKK